MFSFVSLLKPTKRQSEGSAFEHAVALPLFAWEFIVEQITKIAVAIDFSRYSDETLRYAASLAKALSVQLIIAHVVNQRHITTMRSALQADSNFNLDEYIRAEKDKRMQKIQQLLDQADCKGLEVKTVFRIGMPYHELIDIIKSEGVDLLIIGSKSGPNISNVLFGSTAEKMFRQCPVPVVSLRGKYGGSPEEG
jgi:nucleotide-binding universal stress UspA family protein